MEKQVDEFSVLQQAINDSLLNNDIGNQKHYREDANVNESEKKQIEIIDRPKSFKQNWRKQYQGSQIIKDNILNDERVNLMIRNVPKEYTLNELKEELTNSGFPEDAYYRLFIPRQKEKDTVQYAFIHLKSKSMVLQFYERINIKSWRRSPRAKKCTLCYSNQI